ncbi:SpoIIE family protein phosphatase [Embleya scabrispora]|uniref:SpoIIE family protein phosphatase n=1 Tax=Embleya scabrispora TaxID=159449 RepID=UPI000365DF25|nr:SpoIIE family protein phosphatase [Embleya scabrispora]
MSNRDGPSQAGAGVPFDMADMATVLVDGPGLVLGWSRKAEQILGYPAAEVLNRPIAAFITLPDGVTTTGPADGMGGAGDRDDDPVPGTWSGRVTARQRDTRRMELEVRICPLAHAGDRDLCLLFLIDPQSTPWWGVSQSVLERFLTHLPYGVAVLDTDLRYVWLNETLERTAGVPSEERLGRRVSDVLPGMAPEAMEAHLRHALETGESVRSFEHRGHVPAHPDRERVFSTSFFRLDDSAGHVLGVGYMGADITDSKRAQERLTLLTESGARIGNSLDIAKTAAELVETAVPRFADFACVDLLEPVLHGREPEEGTTPDVASLRRVAHRSLRAGCPEAAVGVGEPSRYVSRSPMVRCLIEGKAVLQSFGDDEAARWLADDVIRADRAREFDPRSLIVVPVRSQRRPLGVALFVRWWPNERFEEADLLLAEEFVSRAAVSLDNARRYTREHNAALTLQRSLLPHALNDTPALEVASRYLPADNRDGVGGDWYDVIPLSGTRVALVVGDVVGHGINAAATMGRLRAAVRTLAMTDPAPNELLARLDDLVLHLIDEGPADEDRAATTAVLGATCLYAVYDPITGRCAMARAGHPAPAVGTPDGGVDFVDLAGGPPLGLGSFPFESTEVELAEDSLLALFTDGLVESPTEDVDVGLLRLRRALACRNRSLDEICARVMASVPARPQTDDVALLLARVHRLPADSVVSWDVPTDPAAVSGARDLATGALERWGLADLAFTTELVISELVTNAIRYAAGPVRLRLIKDSVLTCEVSDAGSTSPHLRHARTTDEGGRGLFIVAQLTHRWGTRYTADGKVIWAEQVCPPQV